MEMLQLYFEPFWCISVKSNTLYWGFRLQTFSTQTWRLVGICQPSSKKNVPPHLSGSQMSPAVFGCLPKQLLFRGHSESGSFRCFFFKFLLAELYENKEEFQSRTVGCRSQLRMCVSQTGLKDDVQPAYGFLVCVRLELVTAPDKRMTLNIFGV